MVLPITHVADWEYIRRNKQKVIKRNNRAENSKRVAHTYQAGDLVMLRDRKANKKESWMTEEDPLTWHGDADVIMFPDRDRESK